MNSTDLLRYYNESMIITIDFAISLIKNGTLICEKNQDGSVNVTINRDISDYEYKNQCEFIAVVGDIAFLPQVQSMRKYIQHSDITRIRHIVCVSYMSFRVAKENGLDFKSASRGAMLHDLFYYDWHVAGDGTHRLHGYRHASFALKNAKNLISLSEKESEIIKKHMWPLTVVPPRYRETMLVSNMDKFCSTQEVTGGSVSLSRTFALWEQLSEILMRKSALTRG